MESDNPEKNYAVFSYNQNADKKWKKVFELDGTNTIEVSNNVLENKDKFLSYNLIIKKKSIKI